MSRSTTRFDAQAESQLIRRWQRDRDFEARGHLVATQTPLVNRIARRYAGTTVSLTDLVQEGNLGLLYALDRFDPGRGVRLSTYAAWWIRAQILRYVEGNRGLVRCATTSSRSRLFYQLAKTRQRLSAGGQEVSRDALAHALGVDVRDVEAVEQLSAPVPSLDAPVRDGDSHLDRLAKEQPTPEQVVHGAQVRRRLGRALARFGSTLTGRQLEMFRDRLTSSAPATLGELGARWGVTRAAARRIETQVSRPLRRHLYREMGDSIAVALGGV